jgi:ubiquitin carboxyl-terminal hydrolase 8
VSLKKLLEEAEKYRLEGDEERSYVLYMKFMNLLSRIQKMNDFSKEKSQVSKLLGNNEGMRKNFDRLQELQKSLKERYELKYPQHDSQSMPLAESTRINIDQSMITEPIGEPEVKEVKKEVINCRDLYNMMNDNIKLLIMDCRPEDHYQQSNMNYSYTINVPEKLCQLGMSASRIQERLPNESKVFWELREKRPYIIFVDWDSKIFNRNSPVWHLKEILTEWDQTDRKPEMLLLEGGYEEWKTVYPMKCHNPQFSPPKEMNGDVPALDGIEYPNIDDIQMKDASLNRSIPTIDRSMKPSAKVFDNRTPIQLMEEKEKIMNKSLMNEREMLELETEIKQIVTDKENKEDSSLKEQNIMFKIWELQSKQSDIHIEEKTIGEQLEQSKGQIKEPQEMTKVRQLEQHLKELDESRKRTAEEREKKKREREEALKFARDSKKPMIEHRTPVKAQRKDEIILSPKSLSNQVVAPSIPSFDRSSKPLQPIINRQIFNDQDFSPVYGRVVSKLHVNVYFRRKIDKIFVRLRTKLA